MWEAFLKLWYLVAILPFLLFLEGSKMFGDLLKRKNIYQHWDVWHAYLFLSIVLIIVFWIIGYRW